MEDKISKRGGRREGSGRPKGSRTNTMNFRVSDEVKEILKSKGNASQYIETAILEYEHNHQ